MYIHGECVHCEYVHEECAHDKRVHDKYVHIHSECVSGNNVDVVTSKIPSVRVH